MTWPKKKAGMTSVLTMSTLLHVRCRCGSGNQSKSLLITIGKTRYGNFRGIFAVVWRRELTLLKLPFRCATFRGGGGGVSPMSQKTHRFQVGPPK